MRPRTSKTAMILSLVGWLGLVTTPSPLGAQRADTTRAFPDSVRKVAKLAPIAVTATRTERAVFRTPNPLLVTDVAVIREEAPNGVADLFRNLPGVDMTGVGPNQGRLVIRGQRGQRILLLENGLRLNNTRRQQDFGELPALTDINGVSRVEIVRGPASVLYGTDAIGGVVNQITLMPPSIEDGNLVRGSLFSRYATADAQRLVSGRVDGRSGAFGFGVSAAYRDANEYRAPAGTFGNLTLASETLVRDSGVLDRHVAADLRYDFSTGRAVSLRISRYEAEHAGFGFVEPADLGDPDGPTVRIRYPTQDVTRVSATYSASDLGWLVADRLAITGWSSDNDRLLDIDVDVPFGQPFPPGAGVRSFTRNLTDIRSHGGRVEAAKVFGGRHVLTYGADFLLDLSDNSDSSRTVVTTFGPPSVDDNTTPSVPNAGYRSAGLFAQTDLAVASRLSIGLGLRGQLFTAWTRRTRELPQDTLVSETDATVVGSVSAGYAILPELNLVAIASRAFRAPNLVERFFEGPVAEAGAFQIPNPGLQPETSFNLDLGLKFRNERIYAEAFYFRNTIYDGIRSQPTGSQVGGLDGFRNVNVDRLRDQGLEVLAEARIGLGFSVLGHFTKLSSENADSSSPVGDSYSSKVGGELAWHERGGRFFAAYEIRHQGERDDVELGESPVGDTLPAFTVHNVRAGVRLPEVAGTAATLGVAVLNLADRLYAEGPNTSFFRPEPRRSAVLTLRVDF